MSGVLGPDVVARFSCWIVFFFERSFFYEFPIGQRSDKDIWKNVWGQTRTREPIDQSTIL